MSVGDVALGATIDVKFTTRKFGTSAPFALAGSPAVAAYIGNGTTPITSGVTLTADFGGVTGLNNVRVVASAGNGFAAATDVKLVITAGTVDGVSVVGEVVGTFSIANRSQLRKAALTTNAQAALVDGTEWLEATALRNDVSLAGTILTVKKTDNSTTQYTKTATTDAAADPITGIFSTGTIYYVSTSGSNSNNGTSSSTPWQTLAKLFTERANFNPGDYILLKRGDTWAEHFLIQDHQGTTDGYITYGAYGSGALPLIDANKTRDYGILVSDASHIAIENIKVIDAIYDGIRIITVTAGNIFDIRVNGCVSENSGRNGFYVEASPAIPRSIDDIEFHNCWAHLTGVGGLGTWATGFYTYNVSGVSGGSEGIWFRNCLSTYSGVAPTLGHGFSSTSSENVHFIKCEASHTNIDIATGLDNGAGGEGHGFVFDDFVNDSEMLYCYSHDNQSAGMVGAHQDSNNLIAYNILVNNGAYGLVVNGSTAGANNTLVYNNTINNNGGPGMQIWSPQTGLQIKNNIVSNNAGYGLAFSASGVTSYTVANNVIYNNTLGATQNVTGATGTISSDPLFTGAGDYTLQSGSPARDAGLNLGSPYELGIDPDSATWPSLVGTLDQDSYGTGWEIGAYVYVP